jgi:putrescine transport system ATP-binding protein
MEVQVALRPEKICLQLDAPSPQQRASGAEQGYNCASGVITAIAYFGNETRYHIRLDSGMELRAARTNAARHDDARPAREQRVFAWWDGSDIVVLTS